MTRRAAGTQLRMLKRNDPITADYLNSVAARADKAARALTEANLEEPEGQDGDGAESATSEVYTETSRTTSTVRIEDENDSSIFIDVERMDSVTFQGNLGDFLTLNFNNPPVP